MTVAGFVSRHTGPGSRMSPVSRSGEATVSVDAFSTAPEGREVGRVSVPTAAGEIASPLRLAGDIRDPGPVWRLTHPGTLIGAFLAGQDG